MGWLGGKCLSWQMSQVGKGLCWQMSFLWLSQLGHQAYFLQLELSWMT